MGALSIGLAVICFAVGLAAPTVAAEHRPDDFDLQAHRGGIGLTVESAAAASFGADAISPVHGTPPDGGVTDPGYQPYTTPRLVARAHQAQLDVIPWTVNDIPTMTTLMDAGVETHLDPSDRAQGRTRSRNR